MTRNFYLRITASSGRVIPGPGNFHWVSLFRRPPGYTKSAIVWSSAEPRRREMSCLCCLGTISGGMFPPIEVFIFILLILVGGLEHFFPYIGNNHQPGHGNTGRETTGWAKNGGPRMEPQHAPFRMDMGWWNVGLVRIYSGWVWLLSWFEVLLPGYVARRMKSRQDPASNVKRNSNALFWGVSSQVVSNTFSRGFRFQTFNAF